ncbi:hypothetical protein [Ralstonia phage phiRSL1]|uniref:Uncharacterized protein n=1 Tax=Ralstonia phage phiRSL1 TaxID=1980924 RepID=B2ZY94_9CAUD|nr:hypothetical protein RSL1_ORF280 [Ralstonia phage phiRSL1]BAG41727.1 hypothetical protein [Ralstonia phage phiRSL1]
MTDEVIAAHFCVSPSGHKAVRRYPRFLCSNCLLSSEQSYDFPALESEFEQTKQRLLKEDS